LAIGNIWPLPIQIKSESIEKYIIMGDFPLTGGMQPIKEPFAIAIKQRKKAFKGLFSLKENAREAAIVRTILEV